MSRYASKLTAARVAPARPAGTAHSPGHYTGAELKPFEGRPNSMVAHALASRMGRTLHWPGGIKTDINGNPISTTTGATA